MNFIEFDDLMTRWLTGVVVLFTIGGSSWSSAIGPQKQTVASLAPQPAFVPTAVRHLSTIN